MNNPNPYLIYLVAFGALLLGALVGFMIKQLIVENKRKAQNLKADHIITEAKERAREIELEAKDSALQITQKAEDEPARSVKR